jgi:hypothetical protein
MCRPKMFRHRRKSKPAATIVFFSEGPVVGELSIGRHLRGDSKLLGVTGKTTGSGNGSG